MTELTAPMTTEPSADAPVRVVPARAVLASYFCTDHRALSAFYAASFGWPEIEAVRSPIFTALDAGGVVVSFHHDEAFDLLGLADRRDQAGNRLHLTLDVGSFADVDAAVEPLVALGATVIQGPFTTYYDARQVVLADPEDNVLRISSSQAGVSDRPAPHVDTHAGDPVAVRDDEPGAMP